ncbi:lycopene cyclase family protein [Emticicia sp. 17c]|uniref:lycopene cyclase family protein n=1 Tax=Emticicia sp. 17c TaxID=3127704 RepID=UPI00301BC548
MKSYDYIICGGGMAGLSLAYYLTHSRLSQASILIIEPEEKKANDRTWAFWETTENTFEKILFKNWKTVQFVDASAKKQNLDIGSYHYKLLRGIDFYEFVKAELQQNLNVTWLYDKVSSINDTENGAVVETEKGSIFEAAIVFDSTYKLNLTLPDNHNLLQHFKGYVIKSEKAIFDTEKPLMMDFSIEQYNECRFVYILPFDAHTALIEYTLFTENLLEKEEYDRQLKKYITEKLGLVSYTILEEEFGIIPMSDVATQEYPSKHIVRIGTAGGYTNPATGYTFQNTQRKLKEIVAALEKNGSPIVRRSYFNKRFKLYASVFLNVLEQKRHPAADVFAILYNKNAPAQVFKFLDGDTNLWEELKILNSVPKVPFLKAVAGVFARKIKSLF